MKYLFTTLVLLVTLGARAQKTDTAGTIEYIRKYKDIAIAEMKRVGIPASITLAQGIHESSIGKSYLSQNTNNHFGIKCHENWTGRTFKYTDDAPDECFRVYDSPEDSYKDHSDFLANRPRYAGLFLFAANDYKAWAVGLKKAGYATNPRYPDILIKTIEDFQLYKFDKGENPAYINTTAAPLAIQKETIQVPEQNAVMTPAAETETPQPAVEERKAEEKPGMELKEEIMANREPSEQKIIRVNRRKAVKISGHETLGMIGSILKISSQDLLSYNDINDTAAIKSGDLLFIQKKKNRNWEGRYKVQAQDNMWSISQNKGVQLAGLLKRNKLQPEEEPAVGETIFLKGQAQVKPLLRTKPELKKEMENAVADDAAKNIIDIEQPKDLDSKPASAVQVSPAASPEKEASAAPAASPAKVPSSEVANDPAPAVAAPEPKTVYPAVIDYSKLPKSSTGLHTVVKGDTMYNICKRYNISVAQVVEWNKLYDQSVKLGQVLKIRP